MLESAFFYFFALLSIGGAIFTITLRNAVHCAIALITSLIGVAGLFLLQHAEFLFAVQIILYIGGITVLFLFVIMLVNLDQAGQQRQFNRMWLAGIVCAVVVGAEAVLLLRGGGPALELAAGAAPPAGEGNVQRVADELFSQYLLPFEVASVLLLVAIVGSVLMAKRKV